MIEYTGDDGNINITGVGFQPDLVWHKEFEGTAHFSMDSSRGAQIYLKIPTTDNEVDSVEIYIHHLIVMVSQLELMMFLIKMVMFMLLLLENEWWFRND